MKKLFVAATLVGVMVAPNLFGAIVGDTGTLTLSSSTYSYGNGGEFTAVATALGTFQTFCIEYNEHFSPGGSYDYRINSGAVAGGAGAMAVDPYTTLPMDKISIGTAWLYESFRKGTLPNYFSANTATQKQNAGNLQDAIWYLEGEQSSLSFNGADGTYFYNLAKANAGGGGLLTDAQVQADSNGAYGVVALNLMNGSGSTPVTDSHGHIWNLNQDQLAVIPEPTTMIAGALLLLPFGASTLRIVRKNRVA